MTGINELRHRYGAWASEPYGELYMPAQVALDFVDDCDAADIKTIGVEVFQVIGDLLQPLTDEIADWSSAYRLDTRTLNNETRKFIQRFVARPNIRIAISTFE